MLRCTRVLYFGEHTSCYVARVCFNSVNALHVTLRDAARLFFNSVNAFHFTLRASVALR